jgi:hypothetical protein
MPILDLQRRLHERGRIRIGEKDPSRGFPKKLNQFRFTSADGEAIDAVADLWGGEPRDWVSPNGPQREVYTPAKSIDVLLPPGDMALSQWMEEWSGGGCQKRCDTQWDVKRDVACDCDPENRSCKATTRLSVLLPALPGVGLWRIETHGHYASVELPAVTDILGSVAPGALIPCRLWLDERSDKTTDNKGKVTTRRYVVPVLEPQGQMNELTAGQPALQALASPIVEGAPNGGLTPVPVAALAEGPPARSIRDQVSVAPAGPARRANAAEPIPATGVSVRKGSAPVDAEIVEEGGVPAVGGGAEVETDAMFTPPSSSSDVDLDDLLALFVKRAPSRPAVRKEYNARAEAAGQPKAARFDDMVPGPVLDAVFAWLEAQPPSDGGDGGDEDPDPPDPAEAPKPSGATAPAPEEGGPSEVAPPPATSEGEPEQEGLPLSASDPTEYKRVNRRAQAAATKALSTLNLTDRDLLRRTLAVDVTKGRATSWAQLTASEFLKVEERLRWIEEGTMCIRPTSDPAWPEGWQVDFTEEWRQRSEREGA